MSIRKHLTLLMIIGILLVTAQYSDAGSNVVGRTHSTITTQDDDDDNRRGRRGGREGSSQERSDRESRRQQRSSDRESRRQQEWSDDKSRRQQYNSELGSRQQQQWSDWKSRRQQRDSDRESRRQQEWSDGNSRRQQQLSDWNSWRKQRDSDRRSYRRDDDDDDGDDDRRRSYRNNRRYRDDRRVIYSNPQDFFNRILNSRNYYDQRQDWRADRRERRRYNVGSQTYYNYNSYDRGYSPIYNDNGYNGNVFGYGGGSGFKDQILRMVIGGFLGGGGFDAGSFIPAARYSEPNRYGYIAPSYAYRPASLPYYDSGYSDTGYGNLGGGLLNNNLGGGLLNSLPLAAILQQYTGDSEFLSTLIGGFLSQGYEQGYVAAMDAGEDGYRGVAYQDPYVYSNNEYDPYSATLGENRRYLSEGYELGYRDALDGDTIYNPQSEGKVDLVSALLSNVLSGV